jgi:hypothetical protein
MVVILLADLLLRWILSDCVETLIKLEGYLCSHVIGLNLLLISLSQPESPKKVHPTNIEHLCYNFIANTHSGRL